MSSLAAEPLDFKNAAPRNLSVNIMISIIKNEDTNKYNTNNQHNKTYYVAGK